MSFRPLIAAVALEDDAFPAAEEVLDCLAGHWPEISAAVQPASRPGVLTLALGEDAAGLAWSISRCPGKT